MNILWNPDAATAALAGGALIGLSANLLWALNGRIAGISGIFGKVLGRTSDAPWCASFLLGLGLAGMFTFHVQGIPFTPAPGSLLLHGVAGVLVGAGTKLASGCTSGHGVCGISRFSPRSMSATLTFMVAGGVAVFFFSQAGGL